MSKSRGRPRIYENEEERLKAKKEQINKWKINNKEKLTNYNKSYFVDNKDKIMDRRKVRITCECGKTVNYSYYNKHKTLPYHLKRVNQNKTEPPVQS